MDKTKDDQTLAAIGSRLEITRQVFGLKQIAFAARAKIPQNTYNQYEMGRKRPSLDNALALCDEYDLTLDWIYRGDPSGLRYDLASAIKSIQGHRAA